LSESSLDEELEICTRNCRDMDAPLENRLNAMADDFHRLAPQYAVIVDRVAKHLRSCGVGSTAPLIGEQMPEFVLPDQNGQLVSLSGLLKTSDVVVSFHRGHWCPYCVINADSLTKIAPKVIAAGGQLVVITPEVQKFNRKFMRTVSAPYPILTDLDSGYAANLDLAVKTSDEKRLAMEVFGWGIAEFQDNDNWILPIPATFVVGQDGVIRGRFVDPDYRRRMAVDDLLSALKNRAGITKAKPT
jgi:peroxiredoxin